MATMSQGNIVEAGTPGFLLDYDFIPFTEEVRDQWMAFRARAEKLGNQGDYRVADAVVMRLSYDLAHGLNRRQSA